MARLSGYLGTVKSTSTELIGIQNWTLDISGDVDDVTGFDNSTINERAYVAGLASWKATFEGAADATEPLFLGAGVLKPGATISQLNLFIDATHYYRGAAICTSVGCKTSIDGAVTWSVGCQGTGALTYPV